MPIQDNFIHVKARLRLPILRPPSRLQALVWRLVGVPDEATLQISARVKSDPLRGAPRAEFKINPDGTVEPRIVIGDSDTSVYVADTYLGPIKQDPNEPPLEAVYDWQPPKSFFEPGTHTAEGETPPPASEDDDLAPPLLDPKTAPKPALDAEFGIPDNKYEVRDQIGRSVLWNLETDRPIISENLQPGKWIAVRGRPGSIAENDFMFLPDNRAARDGSMGIIVAEFEVKEKVS